MNCKIKVQNFKFMTFNSDMIIKFHLLRYLSILNNTAREGKCLLLINNLV
jgi:hypothetical protein